MPDQRNVAIELMKQQQFAKALSILQCLIQDRADDYALHYMAGQCCRLLNDIDGAVEYLSRAAEIEKNDAPVYLALGIAFQLKEQWDEAIEALRSAIEVDADYELAYNSLALTQKKRGDLDLALHNYDAAAKALSRRIVKAMQNDQSNPIIKSRETSGTLWVEYMCYAATYLCCTSEGINRIAWPTGEEALEEERTEKHAGLYWLDHCDGNKETARIFLPNYVNTFQASLRHDGIYSNIIGSRGTVLELLGSDDEASKHFVEATEFC